MRAEEGEPGNEARISSCLGRFQCAYWLADSTNHEGLQWLERCTLYAASLSSIHSGPEYTYFSSEKRTTVDYIFTDTATAGYTQSCFTHGHHGLNTSDHLPITCELSIPCEIQSPNDKSNTGGKKLGQSNIKWNIPGFYFISGWTHA